MLVLCAVWLACVVAAVRECGCSPQVPVRNPYVCTAEQLEKAAISLTLTLQSYISPYNQQALFTFVSPSTPVFSNNFSHAIIPHGCCQVVTDLYQHITALSNTAEFIFTNQVPMSAVISAVEGAVKVYAMETTYNKDSLSPMTGNQIVFVWKPFYTCEVLPSCTCNLQLVRIETRSPDCNFNEPLCPAE